MARPGLEPGTPRFSVAGPNLSNWAESLVPSGFRVRSRRRKKSAICRLMPPNWVPRSASVPNGGGREKGRDAALLDPGRRASNGHGLALAYDVLARMLSDTEGDVGSPFIRLEGLVMLPPPRGLPSSDAPASYRGGSMAAKCRKCGKLLSRCLVCEGAGTFSNLLGTYGCTKCKGTGYLCPDWSHGPRWQ